MRLVSDDAQDSENSYYVPNDLASLDRSLSFGLAHLTTNHAVCAHASNARTMVKFYPRDPRLSQHYTTLSNERYQMLIGKMLLRCPPYAVVNWRSTRYCYKQKILNGPVQKNGQNMILDNKRYAYI